MLDKSYIVMDDVIYSSQFTLVALFLRLSLKFTDKNFDRSQCSEQDNIFINDIVTTSLAILKESDDTVFNKILNREQQNYIMVSQELLEWVLDQVDSLDDLDCRVSGLTNLFTSKDVVFVHNPENLIENLIITKLGLVNKTRNPLMIWDNFLLEIERQQKETTEKNKRPSILTANASLIDAVSGTFPIIVPDNYKFINRQGAFGKIVCWALENKEKLKEENNE